MLRSFKFHPWSPHDDTTPFLCEEAGLAVVMTDVSIAMNSYFTLGTKVPNCDPHSFILMPPPPKGPQLSAGNFPGHPNSLFLGMGQNGLTFLSPREGETLHLSHTCKINQISVLAYLTHRASYGRGFFKLFPGRCRF